MKLFEQTRRIRSDPNAIQQIEFSEQLKDIDGVNADGRQTVFV